MCIVSLTCNASTSCFIFFHLFSALAAHNFPEGLATLVAVLDEPKVGVSVAVAIGLHNIPEGICVAMPIYYATGSRYKAFFWATLSGMTELVGALLGWIVLRKVLNRVVFGILFGVIAGMMVYISIKELLPTAHRYDPEDKVTTFSLLGGMALMSLSLVLFLFVRSFLACIVLCFLSVALRYVSAILTCGVSRGVVFSPK
jgi:zinc transporter ZupT